MDRSDASPVDVGTRKQLFADDLIIGQQENVFRTLNQPTKHHDNPIIALEPPQQVGGEEHVIVMGTVMYDDDERLFKMWYECANYPWSFNHIAYATSADGIHWERPNLGIVDFRGSTENNFVFNRGQRNVTAGIYKDPVAAEPSRLYKMIYNCGDGVGVAFSPDGLHWKPEPDVRVAKVSDSPHSVMWEPRLERYVAHSRHWEKIEFADGYGYGGPRGLGTRVVLQSESEDFVNWTPYGIIMAPDDDDLPWDRQFYNMEWMRYEDVYFGFIAAYHVLPGMEEKITPGAPWMDKVDIQLTFSRDNRTWMRAGDRQVFIPTGPEEYDKGMVFVMQHPLVVGDEIRFYYAGFSGLHWATRRNEPQGGVVCLATLRLDGFVSMDAGEGRLTTKTLTMAGDRLVVNADAGLGSIAVEILDGEGQPVPGYSREEAELIDSDDLRHTVGWKGSSDVAALKGRPIALRFHMDRAKLYSFVFAN